MRRDLAGKTCVVGAALLLSLGALEVRAADKPKVVRMSGSFMWTGKRNKRHDLQAEFTQKAGQEWDAVFTFDWNRKPQTYRGTAVIANGKMTGVAAPGNRARIFGFEASISGGRLTGKHHEVKGNRKLPTGDFAMTSSR